MNQEPIFILGAHKSGTSLLRSLFDGHPGLFVIPIETHYFQNMKYWVDNEYRWQRPEPVDTDDVPRAFCDWIHLCNTAADEFGDSVATGIFDEERFRQAFNSQAHRDDKGRIEAYFEAIHLSLHGTELKADTRIIEKSVENAEFAVELRHQFPDTRFVHIVRNPYANLVALRKYKSIGFGYPIMRRLMRTLYNSYYFLYKNQRNLSNYYVIRYEDLVREPERRMREICEFANLSFEPVLLEPTFLGKPWQGNSTSGRALSGIDVSRIDEWKSAILPVEIQYINKLFPFVLRDYHYEKLPEGGGFWKPAKGENLRRYLANRFYRFLLQEWKS